MSCYPTPLTPEIRRVLGLPPLSNMFVFDDTVSNLVSVPLRGHNVTREAVLARAEFLLENARAALATAVREQKLRDPDRHFRGLPECPLVIAAYDVVRAAEAAVARLEREGRRS